MKPATDPGSLDRLHDIITPAPASWWPPAPAWYALAAILLTLLVALAWRAAIVWRRNGYRRAALAELNAITAGQGQANQLSQLAELVKRVGLVAFSRERVASLSGRDWMAFLDHSGKTSAFTTGPGQALESCYEPGAHAISPELVNTVRHWIKHHHAELPC